jgi:hypothetical protein
MSDQILEQLFESPAKVKLLKLFLRNPKLSFSIGEARERAQLDSRSTQNALEKLRKSGFLKTYSRKAQNEEGKKGERPFGIQWTNVPSTAKSEKVYFINPSFILFDELSSLVLKSLPGSKSRMVRRVKGLGRIKLIVLSGIFLKPDRDLARTDILIVGDDISERRFQKFLKQLEAEVGCEIQYSMLSSDEFYYRHKMLDRFLRDILERPHETVINKLGV